MGQITVPRRDFVAAPNVVAYFVFQKINIDRLCAFNDPYSGPTAGAPCSRLFSLITPCLSTATLTHLSLKEAVPNGGAI